MTDEPTEPPIMDSLAQLRDSLREAENDRDTVRTEPGSLADVIWAAEARVKLLRFEYDLAQRARTDLSKSCT